MCQGVFIKPRDCSTGILVAVAWYCDYSDSTACAIHIKPHPIPVATSSFLRVWSLTVPCKQSHQNFHPDL